MKEFTLITTDYRSQDGRGRFQMVWWFLFSSLIWLQKTFQSYFSLLPSECRTSTLLGIILTFSSHKNLGPFVQAQDS